MKPDKIVRPGSDGSEAAIDGLRIAVVHEWLDQMAGSEATFLAIADAFPTADMFALTQNEPPFGSHGGRRIRTTWLDRDWLRDRRSVTLPLMPLAWRGLGGGDAYDVVITSSHAFAKAFPAGQDALHFNYCYTPARYLWYPETDGRVPASLRWVTRPVRRIDERNARTVDYFAGISSEVVRRVRECYGRRATCIAPPVDVDGFTAAGRRQGGFVLAVSRLVPYKRIDLAVEAAAAVGLPIVVVGDGPERGRLRRTYPVGMAEFRGRVPAAELVELYSSAAALVFPAMEDFGIVPVEAQACGCPVVALGRGGALDTVVDGGTGVLVGEQSAAAFAAGLRRVLDLDIDPRACRENALRFGRDRFIQAMRQWVGGGVALNGGI
jgi:glycosyltransferase involved in cell wall biosynthesis